jgi:hypothetical protein
MAHIGLDALIPHGDQCHMMDGLADTFCHVLTISLAPQFVHDPEIGHAEGVFLAASFQRDADDRTGAGDREDRNDSDVLQDEGALEIVGGVEDVAGAQANAAAGIRLDDRVQTANDDQSAVPSPALGESPHQQPSSSIADWIYPGF